MKAIVAGERFVVALKNDGTVWAWGENGDTQLGYEGPSTGNPMPVDGISDIVAIAAGNAHVLALSPTVRCGVGAPVGMANWAAHPLGSPDSSKPWPVWS